MTHLQQLAFDRIEELSKECEQLLPNRFNCDSDGQLYSPIEVDANNLWNIQLKLSKQQDWIAALNQENQDEQY